MKQIPKDRVVSVLREHIIRPPDGVVIMANINDLADELIERLYLDEWFESWDDDVDDLT